MENARISQGKMKIRHDGKIRLPKFLKGDLMVRSTRHDKGKTKKLERKWFGPLKMEEILNKGANLKLSKADGQPWQKLINVSRVKPFMGVMEDKLLPPMDLSKEKEEADVQGKEDSKEIDAQEDVIDAVDEWRKGLKELEADVNQKTRQDVSKEERDKRKTRRKKQEFEKIGDDKRKKFTVKD